MIGDRTCFQIGEASANVGVSDNIVTASPKQRQRSWTGQWYYCYYKLCIFRHTLQRTSRRQVVLCVPTTRHWRLSVSALGDWFPPDVDQTNSAPSTHHTVVTYRQRMRQTLYQVTIHFIKFT